MSALAHRYSNTFRSRTHMCIGRLVASVTCVCFLGNTAAAATPEQNKSRELEVIIVTAQKRVERLLEVPVPVTVINTQELAENSQLRLQDYYDSVPGLGLALIGDGSAPTVVIRGITTGGISNPAVATVIDDVPYGATVTTGVAPSVADIDPNDLARIEVLRGPQGTLYGASSIGGLIKYTTFDPSTTELSGRIQSGVTSIRHGELGYNLRGMINVPLSEAIAIRASAFTARDPGYVDNVQTGEDDINRRDSNGGRLAMLWRPSDSFSLKLGGLIQDSERHGTPDVDTTLPGKFPQQSVPGTGLYDRSTKALSAVANGRIGDLDLMSITGYNIDQIYTRLDVTRLFGGFVTSIGNSLYGTAGSVGPLRRRIEKFNQELRASIPIGEKITWLTGAYYTYEDSGTLLNYLAADSTTGQAVGTPLLTIDQPTIYKEISGFTNVTVEFSDRFDVQIGGRFSKNDQRFSTVRSGPASLIFYGADPSIVSEATASDDALTYLFTPRLKITPDVMIYLRLASGYRPGGANANCGPTVACQYGPDTTQNYELGVKGSAWDELFSFDISLYHIDWKDTQLSLGDPITGVSYLANAARARSRGAELSVDIRPLDGLTIGAWVALNDAELSEDLPATSPIRGLRGDPLPYSSAFSGYLSVEQEFSLGVNTTGFVGGNLTYVGQRAASLSAAATRQEFPKYTQFDFRMGLTHGRWATSIFVNNLTDTRAVLRGNVDPLLSNIVTVKEPRTIGMSLTKTF